MATDFKISVGLDVTYSYSTIRSEISSIVRTINKNPYKIKIDLHKDSMSNITNSLSFIKKSINEINGMKVNIGGSEGLQSLFPADFNETINNIKEVSGKLKTLFDGLDTSNINGQFNSATSSAGDLKVAIESLSDALKEFSGFSLDINLGGSNSIQNNADYGKAIRDYTKALEKEREELDTMLQTSYDDSGNTPLSKGLVALGADRWATFFEMSTYDPDKYFDINKKGATLKSVFENQAEYNKMAKEILEFSGIDTSAITGNIGKSADEMLNHAERLKDGTAQAEESMQKLKNVFGSNIDASVLNENFEKISSGISEVIARMDNFTAEEGKFDSLISSINSVTDAIQNLLNVVNELPNAQFNLSEIITQISEINNEIQKISGGMVPSGSNAQQPLSDEEQLLNDLREELDIENLIAKTRKELYAQSNKAISLNLDDKNGDIYDQINESLIKLKNIESDSASSTEERRLALQELGTQIVNTSTLLDNYEESERRSAEADRDAAQSARELSEARLQLADFRNQINNSLMSLDGAKDGKNTKMYSQLQGLLSSAQILGNGTQQGSSVSFDYSGFTTGLQNLKAEYLDIQPAIDSFVAKHTSAQRQIGNTPKTVQIASGAIGAYNSAISKSRTALNDWTKALQSNDPKVKNTINDITKAREELINLYDAARSPGATDNDILNFNIRSKELNQEIKEGTEFLRERGLATQSFGDRLGGLAEKFAPWFGVTRLVTEAYRAFKQLVGVAIEVDTALTQLKIVTNETNEAYQDFSDNIFKTAQELGTSVTELINATTTYARLGYNLDESSTLAKFTGMLTEVGDIDASSAQDAMTAVIKAFDVDAGQIETVMDKLVAVGNGAPISVSQLAEAMNNASSSLSAAGNTFDESIALLTSANTSIQNASKSSTGLRTIVARLRNMKTELDDMGESMSSAEYDKIVQALTNISLADGTKVKVSLTGVNGELRSTYDVIMDIASVWDDLTSNQQASLAETLAGTRQSEIFYSLMNNAKEASAAMDLATGSAGELQSAYNTYLDSAEAHIAMFKAAFAELGSNLIDGKLVSDIVDLGRALLNILNVIVEITNAVGGLSTILKVAAPIVAISKANKALSIVTDQIKAIKKLIDATMSSGLTGRVVEAAKLGYTFGNAFTAAGSGAVALWDGLSKLQKGLVVITAAVTAFKILSSVADALTETYDEALENADNARESLSETQNKMSDLRGEVESLADKYKIEFTDDDSIETILKKLKELKAGTEISEVDISSIKAQTAAYKAQLAVLEAEEKVNRQTAAEESYEALTKSYVTGATDTSRNVSSGITNAYVNVVDETLKQRERLTSIETELVGKYSEQEDLIKKGQKDTTKYRDVTNRINTLEKSRKALTSKIAENSKEIYKNYKSLYDEDNNLLSEEYDAIAKKVRQLTDEINNASDAEKNLEEGSKGVSEAIEATAEKVKQITDTITSITDVLKGQTTGGVIDVDDYNNLKKYSSALEYHNGTMQYNIEKCNEITKALAEEEKQQIATNKSQTQAKYLENAKKIQELRQQISENTDATGVNRDAVEKQISSLLSENATLADNCKQYDLMTDKLNQATSAYQHWVNSKDAAQSGDMFDGALEALTKINDTLNNVESESYGRIGNEDYKAALDFVIPDSVDRDDQAAVASYLSDLEKYLTFDDDGKYAGLNIEKFCQEAVDAGLMTLNEAGTDYVVAGERTMEDFADGLGMSLPLVQAMFGEMEEFGGRFDWSDEYARSIEDLQIEANEAYEALRRVDSFKDLKLVLDVSGFEDSSKAVDALESNIAKMNDLKLSPNVSTEDIERANDVIRYCVAEKQKLNEPAIMTVDISKVDGELGDAISLLYQFQEALNEKEMNVTMGASTEGADSKIDEIKGKIESMSPEMKAKIGFPEGELSAEQIASKIGTITADGIIKWGVDSSAVGAYQPEGKDGTVKEHVDSSEVDSWTPPEKDGGVNYGVKKDSDVYTWTPPTLYGKVIYSGQQSVNGTANINGTAHGKAAASGDWGTASGGTTLVGELGEEIIVDSRSGRWYTVGTYGPEFRDIPKGSIVFNHLQTESLLSQGHAIGRAHALASGTALAIGTAMVTGGISVSQAAKSKISGGVHTYNGGGTSTGDYTSGVKEEAEEASNEIIDWIEIVVENIERAINGLATLADSAYHTIADRMSASSDVISKLNEQINIENKAYDRYIQQANSVGLSSDLARLVREGAIDIREYDEDTAEKINSYKDWYQKAIESQEKLIDLTEDLADRYQSMFDMVEKSYENQISLLEHEVNSIDNEIELLETRGHKASEWLYESQIRVENETITLLEKELDELTEKLRDAVDSGSIEEGSEAWYEMKIAINDVKEKIQETTNSVAELNNKIRELKWDHFDLVVDDLQIASDQAQFLIDILSHGTDLVKENGRIGAGAIATLTARAGQFSDMLRQTKDYLEEMAKIDEELANDPNNTILRERRIELEERMRDAVLAAADIIDSVFDMFREMIEKELDSLQEIIDRHMDALDYAKELYEYQKRVRDQTADIIRLQKQLSAFKGDTSEEARATTQRIKVDLEDAMEALEETQIDRYVYEQQKMLDNLFEDYSELLNNRLDRIEDLVRGVITAVGVVGTIVGLIDTIYYFLKSVNVFAKGGLVNYTGPAWVDGTKSDPEAFLNADDTRNFTALKEAMQDVADGRSPLSTIFGGTYSGNPVGQINGVESVKDIVGTKVGDVTYNINIPIDHVEDYDDFMNQMRNDRQFENMVQGMTIGQLSGRSSMAKNKYKW